MDRLCEVDGCMSTCRNGTSTYCEKHYSRVKRHGDPLTVKIDHTPAAERWKTSYEVTPGPLPAPCWVWTGPQDSHGYGTISEGRKKRHMAHIFVYEQLVGPVMADAELDHKCRVKLCVNPKHLEPVPHLVNVQRGDAGIANFVKTHCKHGHEFTPENTIIHQTTGHRACRKCQRRLVREAMRERRARERLEQPERTHCKHGHPLTPENVYLGRNDAKQCRTCARVGGGKRRPVT
jgi:hypothetical protein